MPDDLAEQIAWVHQACEAMGVPILTSPGYEADDVIGTLAVRAVAAGYDVAIVSIDKDFFQLVADPHVKVYDPREDGTWFDEAGVVQKFGVKPSQVVDVLALVGDTSDNVAGVPGIGKKGAIDLMTRFGSLDALLDGAPRELKGKQSDTLTDASRRRPAQPRAGDDPHRRAARRGPGDAGLPWRQPRDAATSCSRKLAFRTLVNDYAPTMDVHAARVRARDDGRGARRAGRPADGRRRVRPPHRDRRRLGGARGDRRLHADRGGSAGRLRASRPRGRRRQRRPAQRRQPARRSSSWRPCSTG